MVLSQRNEKVQALAPEGPKDPLTEGKPRGVGGTRRFDLTLLIQHQLFTQKEIFRGKCCWWTPTEL